MKTLFIFILLCIFNLCATKVIALENETYQNKPQSIIAKKYAERFCITKDNNFFEGLDNEKTLKYSYFKYMGFQNEELYSKEMYKALIHTIKEKCIITQKEEREINEFFQDKFDLEMK